MITAKEACEIASRNEDSLEINKKAFIEDTILKLAQNGKYKCFIPFSKLPKNLDFLHENGYKIVRQSSYFYSSMNDCSIGITIKWDKP